MIHEKKNEGTHSLQVQRQLSNATAGCVANSGMWVFHAAYNELRHKTRILRKLMLTALKSYHHQRSMSKAVNCATNLDDGEQAHQGCIPILPVVLAQNKLVYPLHACGINQLGACSFSLPQ